VLLSVEHVSGDQRASVGDNVNVTLSVNFTHQSAVTFKSFHGYIVSGDLFGPSCWLDGYKCSSTSTSTSITVTIHLTNVDLWHGRVYTLTSDTGAWDNVTLTVCGEYKQSELISKRIRLL
jgi:hypothetical protein